jgi:hypothetical protein
VPEAARRERDLLVEREVEAADHPFEDGAFGFLQIVQADLLACAVLAVPGGVAIRRRIPRLDLPVGLAHGEAALVLLSFVPRRLPPVERRARRQVERVLVGERPSGERWVGSVGELLRGEVARDGLAADVAARRQLVPAFRAVRLREDLRLGLDDVPLPEIAEADDTHALVGGLRRVARRPLGAVRDRRRRLDGRDTDRRRRAAIGRGGGELDNLPCVSCRVGTWSARGRGGRWVLARCHGREEEAREEGVREGKAEARHWPAGMPGVELLARKLTSRETAKRGRQGDKEGTSYH